MMSSISEEKKLIVTNKKVCDFYDRHKYLDFEQVNILCVDLFDSILSEEFNTMNKSIGQQILQECIDNRRYFFDFSSENKARWNELNMQLMNIQSNIIKSNTDFTLKMSDIKKDYIEEVKTIISGNTNEKISSFSSILDKFNDSLSNKTIVTVNDSVEKISTLLEKSAGNLVDRTKIILSDIFPENIEKINELIDKDFSKFSYNISQDLQKLINNEREHDKYLMEILQKNQEKDRILEDLIEYLNKNKENELDIFMRNFDSKFSSFFQSIQQPILLNLNNHENKIQSSFINFMNDTNSKLEKVICCSNNMDEFLNKYRNSSNKGAMSEKRLRLILNKIYTSAEVIDTSTIKESCDCLLKRDGKEDILFENKEYDTNVDPSEIKKFIRDCTKQKSHGIFLSQSSGITSKNNYQIDINNYKILVYVHNCEYITDKIITAVDIIDHLSHKFKDLNSDLSEEKDLISKEILEEINNEYQNFLTKKQSALNTIKDFEKRLTLQVKELSLPRLDEYLSKKFAIIKQNYVCEICNSFSANNIKSLSAHKRSCKKNIDQNLSTNSESSN